MPRQSLLSDATYLDQFCFSVSCAVVSSARQAFLSRPRTTDPLPAASQLGSTLSVGGPPARTRTFCPRDGPLARARAFCPRGDTLSGCCSPREPSTGFSSRATSGGRSLTVGCRCPIGAAPNHLFRSLSVNGFTVADARPLYRCGTGGQRERHHGRTRHDRARRWIRRPLSGGCCDHRAFPFHRGVLVGGGDRIVVVDGIT
jgi:hypothetical protein